MSFPLIHFVKQQIFKKILLIRFWSENMDTMYVLKDFPSVREQYGPLWWSWSFDIIRRLWRVVPRYARQNTDGWVPPPTLQRDSTYLISTEGWDLRALFEKLSLQRENCFPYSSNVQLLKTRWHKCWQDFNVLKNFNIYLLSFFSSSAWPFCCTVQPWVMS